MFDLIALIKATGYLGVTGIVFAESGLFFGFFLPGDSLLFTAGFLASQGYLNIALLTVLVTSAAILGDSTGYWFGKKVGPMIFSRPDSRFFSHKRLAEARAFFDGHGAKSIILARFVPAVRTFVPIVAGAVGMRYGLFLNYNIIGGIIWGTGVTLAGYILGATIPNVDRYIVPIVIAIIVISMIPIILPYMKNMLKERREAQKRVESAALGANSTDVG